MYDPAFIQLYSLEVALLPLMAVCDVLLCSGVNVVVSTSSSCWFDLLSHSDTPRSSNLGLIQNTVSHQCFVAVPPFCSHPLMVMRREIYCRRGREADFREQSSLETTGETYHLRSYRGRSDFPDPNSSKTSPMTILIHNSCLLKQL